MAKLYFLLSKSLIENSFLSKGLDTSKLVRKLGFDKNGHRTVKWIKRNEEIDYPMPDDVDDTTPKVEPKPDYDTRNSYLDKPQEIAKYVNAISKKKVLNREDYVYYDRFINTTIKNPELKNKVIDLWKRNGVYETNKKQPFLLETAVKILDKANSEHGYSSLIKNGSLNEEQVKNILNLAGLNGAEIYKKQGSKQSNITGTKTYISDTTKKEQKNESDLKTLSKKEIESKLYKYYKDNVVKQGKFMLEDLENFKNGISKKTKEQLIESYKRITALDSEHTQKIVKREMDKMDKYGMFDLNKMKPENMLD